MPFGWLPPTCGALRARDDTFQTTEDVVLAGAGLLDNDRGSSWTGGPRVVRFDSESALGASVAVDRVGTFTYDPGDRFDSLAAGERRVDTYAYTIADGFCGTRTATVQIEVLGLNDSPVGNDDAFVLDHDAPLGVAAGGVLANDTDVDNGDVLSVSAVNGNAADVGQQVTLDTGALLTLQSDGSFVYDPNDQFVLAPGTTATDSFSYTARDLSGDTATATVTLTIRAPQGTAELHSLDGAGNNIEKPSVGWAGSELLRLTDAYYDDPGFKPGAGFNGIRQFRPSSPNDPLPNPRDVSNAIATQTDSHANPLGASDWLWQWGQFLDHDLDLNEGSRRDVPEDWSPIPVNPTIVGTDDPDPLFAGGVEMLPFVRVKAADGTGTGEGNPREHINEITSFIDASNIYGSDVVRAATLRTGLGDSFQDVPPPEGGSASSVASPPDGYDDRGRLLTSLDGYGTDGGVFPNGRDPIVTTDEDMLPRNLSDVANANPTALLPEMQFAAGDLRANEQVGLTAIHTLMVREHNRLADLIYEQNPTLSGDEIYFAAREIVIAEVQAITYQEFLPLLIGTAADAILLDYRKDGYDPSVDAGLSHEFANAAYRLGHTLLSPKIKLVDDSTATLNEVALQDSFFNPMTLYEDGVDPILAGLQLQLSQDLDSFVVDGVRNFLFPAETGGFDLAAVNTKRGRDAGLPNYNEARAALGLDPATGFEDITPGDPTLAAKFATVYQHIDDVDLWIGGISEAGVNGGLAGELFSLILTEQFARTAFGDRFFYLNKAHPFFGSLTGDGVSSELGIDINDLFPSGDVFAGGVLNSDFVTLADIIAWNTPATVFVGESAFLVPFETEIKGGDSQNVLRGSTRNDLIEGCGGRDVILALTGDDIAFGGDGRDLLFGNGGDDALYGGGEQDFLVGGRGDDLLLGGEGCDMLVGNAGADVLGGGDGADTLTGGQGPDTFVLGSGRDIIRDFEIGIDTIAFEGDVGSPGLTFAGRSTLVVVGTETLAEVFTTSGAPLTPDDFDLI